MHRFVAAAGLCLIAAGCAGETTAPPVATTVQLSTSALGFDAVGQTHQLTATVLDQHGASMPEAPVTFTGSGVAAVVTTIAPTPSTPATAVVRSLAGGVSQVTATSGGASASVAVTVEQVVASMQGFGGSGRVNEIVTPPAAVTLLDRLGTPVPGRVVTFEVVSGGGAVLVPSATTGAGGSASTQWRLGTSTSVPHEILATSGTVTARFRAQVLPGAPATIRAASGDGQSGPLNTAVSVPPAVRVADAFDNPVYGLGVVFTVTGGGGAVTGASVVTNASGVATVGSFVLGPQPGANSLRAAVSGVSSLVVPFQATGTPTGSMGSIVISAGSLHAAIAGTEVPVRPAVLVRDGAGEPRRGVPVTFSVRSGGGTIPAPTVLTDSAGVATVGAWTLGRDAAPNSLAATTSDPDLPVGPLVFTAIGCTPTAQQGFSISVCFTTDVTPSQRAAFTDAATRWGTIITGDVPDFASTIPSACGSGISFAQGVDDVMILAGIQDIDGPGAVLGSAGPCIIRSGSFLPLIGVMRFDAADVGDIEARNQFVGVILHEMGHVLGIGTLWQLRGLLALPSSSTDTLDTHFTGARAVAEFDGIGGTAYTAGLKVPVENKFGPGTRNAHWRESVLRTELMTGFLNRDVANPLSALTVGSLIDLGYAANTAAADAFTFTAAMQANASRSGTPDVGIHLGNDVYAGPVHTVGRDGRLVRIR